MLKKCITFLILFILIIPNTSHTKYINQEKFDYTNITDWGSTDAIQYALNNNIQIINRSMTYSIYEFNSDNNLAKKAYDKGIFMNGSSGNAGMNTIESYGKSMYWWNTGALELNNNIPQRTYYSSTGIGLKSMSFSSLLVCEYDKCNQNTVQYYHGTSASAPFLSGMVALYYQYHMDKFKRFPTSNDVRDFIMSNSIDLEKRGYDMTTGYGLFVLPPLDVKGNIVKFPLDKTNPLAVRMMDKSWNIRYVHKNYVLEYMRKGYKLY